MAVIKNKPKIKSHPDLISNYFNKEYIKKLIFDPHCLLPICYGLFIFEVILNVFIIERVNYTEIDWKAYMQEVEGFLNGTLDYSELKGDTGPLVYPAGFVYFYSLLYYVTSQGTNIYLAQYIFLGIYLIQIVLTYRILVKTAQLPPYALILITLTSYRIHSIYVLRLFNDPIATLLFYASLNCFMSNKWKWGSFLYSLAVSVKMNILLYAPCLLVAYLTNLSYKDSFYNLTICGFVQLVLAVPFLIVNPYSYIKGSFDLGRIFEHKWTVNYRFLPIDIFANRLFHIGLLVIHIVLLFIFLKALKQYLSCFAKLSHIITNVNQQIQTERQRKMAVKKKEKTNLTKKQRQFLESYEKQLKSRNDSKKEETFDDIVDSEAVTKFEQSMSKSSQLCVLPFFVTNFIGIVCARSLHYQFYSWYFHSLGYLAFCTPFSEPFIFLLLGLIEYCWNVYPSTVFSSLLLHVCHLTLLYGLYKRMKL